MSEPQPPVGWPRRLVRGVLAVIAAIWILFEEWIWDSLAAFMAQVGRLPIVRQLEALIAKLPPYAAMVSFVIPWLILLPAKFLALWLMGTGHVKSGVLVFVVAKIVGTAIIARLFALTKPALLTIRWFARLYTWFTGWRDRVYAYVKAMPAWLAAKEWIARTRASMRAWYRSRFGD